MTNSPGAARRSSSANIGKNNNAAGLGLGGVVDMGGQEKEMDREMTMPMVTIGAGADEARRREEEEAAEKAVLAKVAAETCDLYHDSWVN